MKQVSWNLKRSCKIDLSILINQGEDHIFRARTQRKCSYKSGSIYRKPQIHIVRALTLQAGIQAKEQSFHGKLFDVGAGK
jgi:hypothetical protein